MSHQLSECPNCRRTYVGGPGSAPGRCRICGTPLFVTGPEKEAEIRDRLYGPHISVTRVGKREATGT
jgi:hypothetical protein